MTEFYAGDVFDRGYAVANSAIAASYNSCASGVSTHAEGYNSLGAISTNYLGAIVNKGVEVKLPIVRGIARLRRSDLKTLR